MLKIGILIIATNKYIKFFSELEKDIYKHFLQSEDVNIILFTNNLKYKPKNKNTTIIKIKHEKWPYTTLKRFEYFNNAKNDIKKFDYIFYLDVDMKIINPVENNILANLIGTTHPGYSDSENIYFPTSQNKESKAYIDEKEKLTLNTYFAGGFFGGQKTFFLKLIEILDHNIKLDIKNNAIPTWHDESHLNKYFSINPPDKILSSYYCFDQRDLNKTNQSKVKIVAIAKNHLRYRSKFYLLALMKQKLSKLKVSFFKQ